MIRSGYMKLLASATEVQLERLQILLILLIKENMVIQYTANKL